MSLLMLRPIGPDVFKLVEILKSVLYEGQQNLESSVCALSASWKQMTTFHCPEQAKLNLAV